MPGFADRRAARPFIAFLSGLLVLAGGGIVAEKAVAADSQPAPVTAWGWNIHGELGTGTTASEPAPAAVLASGALAGTTVVQVSAGDEHACALTSAGMVACWGENDHGQLGNGTTTRSLVPVAVTGGWLAGRRVTQVSAGHAHTCAVADGRVSCWGSGATGALGTATTDDATVPAALFPGGAFQPPALNGLTVTQVSAGNSFTCATASGQAYCWGANASGQLGDGTTTGRFLPLPVSTADSALGAGFLKNRTVTQVSAGLQHACAVTADGGLACWGANEFGQVGRPTAQACAVGPCSIVPVGLTDAATPGSGFLAGRSVSQVSAGWYTTCAVTSDGAAACWGANEFGEVGFGVTTERTPPVGVSTAGDSALAGKAVTAVAVARGHACARGSDGSLACWGQNGRGELGVPTTPTCTPTGVPCSPLPVSVAQGSGGSGSGLLAGSWVLAVSTGMYFTVALAESAPGAPSGVRAVAGDARASVTWTAPSGTGGRPVISYLVQKSTDSGATWQPATAAPVPSAATTADVTGLANAVPVTFRVAATNALGTGPFSAASTPVTPAAGTPMPSPPGTPRDVTAAPGVGSATVRWSPPATTGGASVTSYLVQQSLDAAASWQPAAGSPVAVPATSVTVTGLANGTAVVFRVAAVNAAGAGPWSAVTAPVTPRPSAGTSTTPGPVLALTGVSRARGRASLAWQPPVVGGTVTGYAWRFRRNSGRASAWRYVPASTRKLTLRGLTPGALYTFGVRATSDAGTGPIRAITIRVRTGPRG